MANVIYCSNCGTENVQNAKFCTNCGNKIEKVNKQKNKSQKPKEKQNEETKGKTLATSNVLAYAYGLLILGIAFLFAIGTFDTIEPDTTVAGQGEHNHSQPDPHSGVNMANFQKIEQLEQKLQANPADHTTLLELAHLLNDSGLYDRAIVKYKEYLKTHPENTDVLVDMGVCYYNKSDYENATINMSKAIDIDPTHQIAHFNLGIVNFAQNKLSEAIDWWEKAIEINPTNNIGQKAKDLIEQNK